MILIVTGGIGSGKSEVCRILNGSYGYPVYNADKRAKELYTIYPELLDSIEARLQGRFRNNESVFCPKMLAERIFNDKSALETVESLLFPYLLKDFRHFSEHAGDIVVFESATVLDKPFFDGFGDKVLLVKAECGLCISRAVRRDGSDVSRILSRMENQSFQTPGSHDDQADYIIVNDGTLEELEASVDDIVKKINL